MAISPVLDPKFKTLACVPPDPKQPGEPKRWTFSFRYWRQIEFFGLDRTEPEWFASLLAKLSALSEEELEKFLCDSGKRDVWRYHHINWGQKNIPIKIDDLSWIPESIRKNQDEFPIVQFQVSTSLGRVIGFWDKDHVFNIVLLDPFHNLQPSKDHNYRVDPCNPLGCDYSRLLAALDDILADRCSKKACDVVSEIKRIPTTRDSLAASNVLMVRLTDEDIEYGNYLIEQGEIASLNQIFREGLAARFNSAK